MAKLSQPSKIAFIGSKHSNTQTASARGDQCIVGQPALPDFFVVMFDSQLRKNVARLHPVALIRHKNPCCTVKIPLQPLYDVPITFGRPSKKFFQYYGAEPEGSAIRNTPERLTGVTPLSQR